LIRYRKANSKTGTGIVYKVSLQRSNTKPVERRSTIYVFEITDAAYTAEQIKVIQYFGSSSPDSTAKLAAFNVIKDLAIPGVYT